MERTQCGYLRGRAGNRSHPGLPPALEPSRYNVFTGRDTVILDWKDARPFVDGRDTVLVRRFVEVSEDVLGKARTPSPHADPLRTPESSRTGVFSGHNTVISLLEERETLCLVDAMHHSEAVQWDRL